MTAWKNTVAGLILYHVETLDCYKLAENPKQLIKNLFCYVSSTIESLPWYYRLPTIFSAELAAVFFRARTGVLPADLTTAARTALLKNASWFPPFGILSQLVRVTALLKLFDELTIPPQPGPAADLSKGEQLGHTES